MVGSRNVPASTTRPTPKEKYHQTYNMLLKTQQLSEKYHFIRNMLLNMQQHPHKPLDSLKNTIRTVK